MGGAKRTGLTILKLEPHPSSATELPIVWAGQSMCLNFSVVYVVQWRERKKGRVPVPVSHTRHAITASGTK